MHITLITIIINIKDWDQNIRTYITAFIVIFYAAKVGDCDLDSECLDNQACIMHQCTSLCGSRNPCGRDAECKAMGHREVCKCPVGWAGDPQNQCFKCRFYF